MYLDLLVKILTNVIYQDPPIPSEWAPGAEFDPVMRAKGLDWPSRAHTMVGIERLDQLRRCVESVIAEGIPGDLLETGVWRGGSAILMRAVLAGYGVRDRVVWLADSFAGMPEVAGDADPADHELELHRHNDVMAVSMPQVRENFSRYGLLDDQVQFLPGWFRDSLPLAPVARLALLRLDGDLYSSTMDALTHLYPKVSTGGYVIVDDYVLDVCQRAVGDYRAEHGITDPIREIDGVGVYWRKDAG